MRRMVCGLLVLVMGALLAGCAGQGGDGSQAAVVSSSGPQTGGGSSSPAAVDPPDPIAIIEEMMALDYSEMTVTEFNEAIVELCEKQEQNIFAVIADAYDRQDTFERGFNAFMRSTLNYSSQEIFGEPVYIGHAAYITARGVTAAEMLQKEQEMDAAEYSSYIDGMIADIDLYVTILYNIEYDIADADTLLVAQRDSTLNGARAAIDEFVVGLSEEEILAGDIEQVLAARFEELSRQYSSEAMTVRYVMQDYENGIDEDR